MPYVTTHGSTGTPIKLWYEVSNPEQGIKKRHNVLAITGFQTEGWTWEPQVEFLNNRGHAICTLDNRGVGRTEKPWEKYTTNMMARDACCVLEDLGWDPAETHLLGISMGGMISLELLASLAEGSLKRDFPSITSDHFLSAALMVTQRTGWLRLTGLPPISSVAVNLSMVNPFSTPKERMMAGMSSTFSRKWLESHYLDGTHISKRTGKPLTNFDALAIRGSKHIKRKIRDGHEAVGTSASGLYGQVMALITHHVSDERLKKVADAGTKVLVVAAGRDKLVRYGNQRELAKSPLSPTVHETLVLKTSNHGVTDESRDDVHEAIERLYIAAEAGVDLKVSRL